MPRQKSVKNRIRRHKHALFRYPYTMGAKFDEFCLKVEARVKEKRF